MTGADKIRRAIEIAIKDLPAEVQQQVVALCDPAVAGVMVAVLAAVGTSWYFGAGRIVIRGVTIALRIGNGATVVLAVALVAHGAVLASTATSEDEMSKAAGVLRQAFATAGAQVLLLLFGGLIGAASRLAPTLPREVATALLQAEARSRATAKLNSGGAPGMAPLKGTPRQGEQLISALTQEGGANAAILARVNGGRGWFHAKKTAPVWAKQAHTSETITTLEGTEAIRPGDFVCRGAAGEPWPQKASDLMRKYDPTGEVDATGYRKFIPKPDGDGVMAAQVHDAFSVETSWGNLTGKPGDFIVKEFADRDTLFPSNVWIVAQSLFRSTYQRM